MEHHNFMPFSNLFQKEAKLRISQSSTHCDPTLSQLLQSQLPLSQDSPQHELQPECMHQSRVPVSPRPRSWHNTSFSNHLPPQLEPQVSPKKPATRTQSLTASDDSCMYTRLLLEASAARDSPAVPVTPRPRTTSAPPSLVHVPKIKRAPLQQQRNSQKRTLGTLIEVDELAYTAKSAARMKPLPRLPSDSPIRKTAARRRDLTSEN